MRSAAVARRRDRRVPSRPRGRPDQQERRFRRECRVPRGGLPRRPVRSLRTVRPAPPSAPPSGFLPALPLQHDGTVCPSFDFFDSPSRKWRTEERNRLVVLNRSNIPCRLTRRAQAIFLETVNYHDFAERAAILDRECMGDSELRKRADALLKAHDQFNDFVNQPLVGPDGRAPRFCAVSDIGDRAQRIAALLRRVVRCR